MHLYSKEEAKQEYDKYLKGHIQNVNDALELLYTLDIPFVKENIDELREYCSVHDDSKWSDKEYFPYLHHFYPTSEKEANMTEEFEAAVQLHCLNNRHHWNCQDWIDPTTGNLKGGFDEKLYKIHTIERICDWLAMGYQHSESTPYKWWDENKEGMSMPDYAREMIEDILHKVPNDYKLSFKVVRGDLDEGYTANNFKYWVDISFIDNIKGHKRIDTKDLEQGITNSKNIDGIYLALCVKSKKITVQDGNHRLKVCKDIGLSAIPISGVVAYPTENIEDNIEWHSIYIPENIYNKYCNINYKKELTTSEIEELLKDYIVSDKKLFEELVSLDTMNKEVIKKLGKRVKKSKTSNTIEIDTQMTNHDAQLEESLLTEMTANDIIRKSKNEDPERINRSKKVKTTYIGMSKFGILNFKTTSQSRTGYHYQTVEFQDMKFFEDIIKSGRAITPDDVKKAIETQDINVWCTDESFTWWAWGHLAYKYDFLYIDDRIPDLKSRIQAPTVNNVRLNGGSCKHILSVLSYIKKPFTLLAISDDMNAYLNQEETKTDKQDDITKDRADQVKNWDLDDVEKYTGLSKEQIMADISKTLQIAPLVNKEEIIADLINDAPLPEELQGLKREIIDKTIELINNDMEKGE